MIIKSEGKARKGKDMILADKIINERKKNGWSQEELAEMLSVSRQSVSKWEGAQAVPDLTKIIKMAEIFGVSTDYLLKDEIEEIERNDTSYDNKEELNLRKVSIEDAQRYIKIVKKNTPSAIIATVLFVLCPVTLIILAGLSSYVPGTISETFAALAGLIVLFISIAVGVALWIAVDAKEKEFEFLENEDFETLYGVDGMVKEARISFDKKRIPLLILAILSCILCPVGVITTGILEAPDMLIICMIDLLLFMIAFAVGIFIYIARIGGIYSKLLRENVMTPEERKRKRIIGKLSGTYWCLVVAVFMVFGLAFNRWELSGVIFPISGVLYAAIIGIIKIFVDED